MRPSLSVIRFYTTAIGALFIGAGMAQAGVGDQLLKLLPDDGASDDLFGASVAISGSTAIIGATQDNSLGPGSAYLFDTSTGLQIAKLLANDGAIDDFFGSSVALSGTTAIVGATFDDDNDSGSGSAYLFDTSTGLQIAKLLPDDGSFGAQFGVSVAIDGTTAIVGAWFDNDNGTGSGAAYLFDTSTGLQIAKLLPDDGASFDLFGSNVAISGSTAIVGAYQDDDNGAVSGSAYLFDTSTGLQIAKLLPNDGVAGARFGFSVALSGTTALIGARGDTDNGVSSGSAYLFDVSTGLQIGKLLPADGANGDRFGVSVALSDSTAIVGAYFDSASGNFSGSAYLFDISTGLQIAKLTPSDGAASDFFGVSVAIGGSTAIAGANRDDDHGIDSGSAYLFEAPQLVPLASDVPSISLATGGSQVLALELGVASPGWFYFMFGSVTGTTPGIDFAGILLPLNFDVYFNLTLTKPGLGAFGNFRGTLDGLGQAQATLTLPALMDPSLVGVTLNHAYLAGSVFGTPEFASDAVPVLLAP